ncbi:ring-cleaving dioxygenase [Arsenicitalea aurantiaca]|uniref:Ring-cleaving dioxygenase n=1 Tax=Arsenicitalea aurantiaca TaxID=1783274 RepID=A0A433XKW3_9HYPH|nr:ring-cleaving dioxygenase [Arsenicitalea aurantiaca]RUT34727.1 ring-cleaving dioxygenase [Arsenicitalea aurantiaca]
MALELSGIHHLTAVSARASENLDFYTRVLGMRLIKKTVNQDDTTAYHLFYGDGVASPGSDLTFFDFNTLPERRGTNAIVRTALRVRGGEEGLAWWKSHLQDQGVGTSAIKERVGHLSLDFEDFEGQRLRFVADETPSPAQPWEKSTIPAERQMVGLGPITMSVPNLEPTELVLTRVMGMRKARVHPARERTGETHVFEMGEGGPGAELHVQVDPDLRRTGPGAGGVHHVAFRTPDKTSLREWIARVHSVGLRSSGEVERYYFTSLYFREPNGILFEIATDEPGFTADEPLETLGESLALPPFLEPRRASIEAGLKPLA